jgi:hypothetical protein
LRCCGSLVAASISNNKPGTSAMQTNTTTTDSSTNGSTNGSANGKRAPREAKAPNPFDIAAKISKQLQPFSPTVRKSIIDFVTNNDVIASVDGGVPSDEQA